MSLRYTQKAVGTVKATTVDTKGAVDKTGERWSYPSTNISVEMEREGTTIKISFGDAVSEAWFSLFELQSILTKMQQEAAKETNDYYER